VISDSESELVSSNMLVPEENSIVLLSGSDLEPNSVSNWLPWIVSAFSINLPTLVESIMTVPPGGDLHVVVSSSPDVETFLGVVSEILSASTVPGDPLIHITSPWSHASSDSNSELVVELVGHNLSSISPCSNGLCSPVEDEPLSAILRHVVSDSKSLSVVANVFMPEKCFVSTHSGFDLESDSVSERISWILDSLEVEPPSLVCSVVAQIEVCETVLSCSLI